MAKVLYYPECSICHSDDLELFYCKSGGLIVQCDECGNTAIARNEHLASDTITLQAS